LQGIGNITPGSAGGTATGGDINRTGQTGGFSHGTPAPGVGGVMGLARGPDGSAGSGNAGIPGGLIIAWFNNAPN
jgi:hypothetical protein